MQTLPALKETKICFREIVPEIPSTTYGTFGLYRYPAKFIPQIIAYILKNYSKPGTSLLDPFAGSGTAGLVSRIYNLDYELWDLNPMLEILHSIAVMRSPDININKVVEGISLSKEKFLPDWPNLGYWFPEQVIPYFAKIWGGYHSLNDSKLQQLLLVPLLKITRQFSYNDEQRQKLSSSPIARKRVMSLLKNDWQSKIPLMLACEIKNVIRKTQEYQYLLSDKRTGQSIVKGGIDVINASNEKNIFSKRWNILVTSPPYLQAQEYIRNSKLDLFWLGYPENEIKKLSKSELPYRNVEPIEIYSKTYEYYHNLITEPHLCRMFERYFYGVLGTLSRLSSRVADRLFLFVGPASVRSIPIPIDRILIEHFVELGWEHEITFIDTIVSRVMFRSNKNPANGLKDKRIETEQLVVLKRKKK